MQVGVKRGLPANLTILDVQQGPHTILPTPSASNYEGQTTIMPPMTTIVNGEIMYNTIVTDY